VAKNRSKMIKDKVNWLEIKETISSVSKAELRKEFFSKKGIIKLLNRINELCNFKV